MQKIVKSLRHFIQKNPTRNKLKERSKILISFIRKRPWVSFFGILGLLLLLIIGSILINRPKSDQGVKERGPKRVDVYRIGELPRVSLLGKIEKSGVIKINAQMGGIIQDINVLEGQSIKKSANLIQLSSTYDGANISSVQRQLAQTQYKNVVDTFDSQKDLIKKQREIADKTNANAEELRSIGRSSLDETRTLLSFNEELLRDVESLLQSTQTPPEEMAQAKQLRAQLLSATNQIKSALRQLEYQTNEDKPQAQLSDLGKEITLKQLDIQEKSLEMNKELLRLQLNLAFISESLMHPTSPITGVVERVFVKKGQSVTPGDPLLIISGNTQEATIVVLAPSEIADAVSRVETSTVTIGYDNFQSVPSYISANATDGVLYTIMYSVPDVLAYLITDSMFVTVEIPIGYPDTTSAAPYVPLDAVYQTQDSEFVYVIAGNKVKSKTVRLGQVLGTYVQVENGISQGDRIIINRNVIEGETVSTK